MGLQSYDPEKVDYPDDQSGKRPLQVIRSIVKPVVEAQRQFYRTNPKETLELIVLSGLGFLVFIGELFTDLPIGFYISFIVLILCYFNIPDRIVKAKGKKKKK